MPTFPSHQRGLGVCSQAPVTNTCPRDDRRPVPWAPPRVSFLPSVGQQLLSPGLSVPACRGRGDHLRALCPGMVGNALARRLRSGAALASLGRRREGQLPLAPL